MMNGFSKTAMIDDEKARAFIYARVSTGFQVNGISLEGQIAEVRTWARDNGYTIIDEYIDEGLSGQSVSRRASFRRMIADIDMHKPSAILCWKHSRLFRNLEESLTYKHMLLKKGVKLISVKEPIEDGPVGRLIEYILMALNEFYSANLAEDSLRGLCELARQGYLTCKPLYGYRAAEVRNDKGYIKHRAVIAPGQARVVRQIYQWRAEGIELREIRKRLNSRKLPSPGGGIWRESAVFNILHLHREKYLGNLIFNQKGHKGPLNPINCIKPRSEWIIVPGGLPAIITQEMADRIPPPQANKRTKNREGQ